MKQPVATLIRRFLVVAVLITAAFSLTLYAQSGAGSIQGTVTDPSGAVVPVAAVHVLNQATGVAVQTTTSGVGFYQVPGLNTGTYLVSISAPGMKTYNRTIELLVAQDATINATLTAGAVTQQVTVSADTVQLQTTDNGTITSTLENARINELPMNGRNIITLVNETTPGLESCPESSSCANGQEGPRWNMKWTAPPSPTASLAAYTRDRSRWSIRTRSRRSVWKTQRPVRSMLHPPLRFSTPSPAPTACMARRLRLPATTTSASPAAATIPPATPSRNISATNSAFPWAVPSSFPISTTEETRRSSSLPTSGIRWRRILSRMRTCRPPQMHAGRFQPGDQQLGRSAGALRSGDHRNLRAGCECLPGADERR